MKKRAFSLRRRLLISLLLMLALGFCALALSLFDTRDELRRPPEPAFASWTANAATSADDTVHWHQPPWLPR